MQETTLGGSVAKRYCMNLVLTYYTNDLLGSVKIGPLLKAGSIQKNAIELVSMQQKIKKMYNLDEKSKASIS